MAADMRSRSRAHTAGAKAGSAISRAARATARGSRASSVRLRRRMLRRSLLALAAKRAPKSAQASPRRFSSSASWRPSARTPLVSMSAVASARPALAAGSRRLPASKSICTSSMGMEGLAANQTCAPLGRVKCSMGAAAWARPGQASRAAKAQAPASRARRAAGAKEVMVCFPEAEDFRMGFRAWLASLFNARSLFVRQRCSGVFCSVFKSE